jgi:putative RecB family exonuclease
MTLPLPEHMSVSQMTTYEGCPRRYFLSRVRGAPATPAWYNLIGSAVHKGIESDFEVDNIPEPVVLLNQQAGSALKAEPDWNKWLSGGSKDEPIVEDRALKLVSDSLDSYREFKKKISVRAVETTVKTTLPGCSRPTVGVIDSYGLLEGVGETIMDWKTGSSKPKDNIQLETYRSINVVNGEDLQYDKGLFVMLRPGARQSKPVDLSGVDPEKVGARFASFEKSIENRVWRADPGYMCRWCDQKPNCRAQSGVNARTVEWDTSAQDGYPF